MKCSSRDISVLSDVLRGLLRDVQNATHSKYIILILNTSMIF